MNSKSKWWEKCSWNLTDGPKPINPTDYQIFVGGLNTTVDERHLRSIFEQRVGPVWDVTVLKFRDGRSRGFGLVQFISKDSINKAMEIGDIMIADTLVKLRRAVDKKEAMSHAKLLFKKKLVLFGLRRNMCHQHLESYFKVFGEIERTQIFEETPEGHDLRQGFVQFSDEAVVSRVLHDLEIPEICLIDNIPILMYSGQAKGVYVKAWRPHFIENLNLPIKALGAEMVRFAKEIITEGASILQSIISTKEVNLSTTKPSSQGSSNVKTQPIVIVKRKFTSSQTVHPKHRFDPEQLRWNRSNMIGSKQTRTFFGF